MERDDIIEYSLDTHHNAEQGKAARKTIFKVTAILTALTALEVAMGIFFKQDSSAWQFIKWSFIVLTLVKASYIVLTFMHLGQERKNLKLLILVPYLIFIAYLIFILLKESIAVNDALRTYGF